MKKNVIIKTIITILIIFTLINYIPVISKASFVDDVFKDGKGFLETGTDQSIKDKIDGVQIIKASKAIYNILLTIGIIVASIVVLVLGIQFMTGSIEQKAKVKEMIIPFVVGCVVIFGSLGIWKFVVNLATSVTK